VTNRSQPPGPAPDSFADYDAYLVRFRAALGAADVGGFVKHQGHLIQKLDPAGFDLRYREYIEMSGHYIDGIDRGDTVNDLVVKLIRDHAAQLIVPSPV
jgi:hypothetical protein